MDVAAKEAPWRELITKLQAVEECAGECRDGRGLAEVFRLRDGTREQAADAEPQPCRWLAAVAL